MSHEYNMMRTVLQTALAGMLVMSLAACGGASGARSGAAVQKGEASYYADKFQGRTTANGERYDHRKKTAAHRTLPFGTEVRVTRLSTGRSVTVRINDRGPFKSGRIIDLSKSAARELGMLQAGVVQVKVEVLTGPASDSATEPTRRGGRGW